MTENEAKIFIQNAMEQSKKALAELLLISPKVFAVRKKRLGEYYSNLENCKKEIQSCEVAIKALEEIQKYRAIGTVEELITAMKYVRLAKAHRTVGRAIEECAKYEEIGILEECRAAVEKQTARKGIREKIKEGYNRGMHHYYCPVCYEKGDLRNKYNVGLYCSDCGQKLDWSDEE